MERVELHAGTIGPIREERAWVHCGNLECGRSVQMDPARVRGKAGRFRCMGCGHKGAQVVSGWYPVTGDRSNVVPLRRRQGAE